MQRPQEQPKFDYSQKTRIDGMCLTLKHILCEVSAVLHRNPDERTTGQTRVQLRRGLYALDAIEQTAQTTVGGVTYAARKLTGVAHDLGLELGIADEGTVERLGLLLRSRLQYAFTRKQTEDRAQEVFGGFWIEARQERKADADRRAAQMDSMWNDDRALPAAPLETDDPLRSYPG